MARQVIWTRPALEDLEEVASRIAHDSETYAASFVREVREAALSLGEFAERGQVVPEFRDPTVRELLIRPYRLVYEIIGDQVLLVGLIHGARRYRRF